MNNSCAKGKFNKRIKQIEKKKRFKKNINIVGRFFFKLSLLNIKRIKLYCGR